MVETPQRALPHDDSVQSSDSEVRPRTTWRTAAVGLVMGAADIVPGVSGGTVALVLGVYQRLLTAITRFDRKSIAMVFGGQWRAAAERIDLRFLLTLGVGIAVGLKGLASVMTYLLSEQRQFTFALFFGLILASGVLVARMAKPGKPAATARCVALGVAAAMFAVWLLSQGRLQPLPGPLYTAASGAVAICAMILPGISGAYLLLMLGKYEEVSGILHRLPAITGTDAVTLAAFAVGCAFGLLAFSRVLKWLLEGYRSVTLATLAGFMIGSLYRVWPFQRDTTPDVEEMKLKVFEPVWPETFGGDVGVCLLIAVAGFALVLVADWLAGRVRS